MFTLTLTRTTRLPSPPRNPLIMMKPRFKRSLRQTSHSNAKQQGTTTTTRVKMARKPSLHFHASRWCTRPSVNQTLTETQRCLVGTFTTCPHVDWHRCMKRPPPWKVMPRLNRLCRFASNWLKSHAIERRRFAQQDKNTTPTKCRASEIDRIITTTNQTKKHFRNAYWNARKILNKKTSHNTQKNWPV